MAAEQRKSFTVSWYGSLLVFRINTAESPLKSVSERIVVLSDFLEAYVQRRTINKTEIYLYEDLIKYLPCFTYPYLPLRFRYVFT